MKFNKLPNGNYSIIPQLCVIIITTIGYWIYASSTLKTISPFIIGSITCICVFFVSLIQLKYWHFYSKKFFEEVIRVQDKYKNTNPNLFKKIYDSIDYSLGHYCSCIIYIYHDKIKIVGLKNFEYLFNVNGYKNISTIEQVIFCDKIANKYKSHEIIYIDDYIRLEISYNDLKDWASNLF